MVLVIIGLVWRVRYVQNYRNMHVSSSISAEYRQREKAKARAAMSQLQYEKALALNQGDVADLEWDGRIAVIIMEKTCGVYEWDGWNWVDRNPDSQLFFPSQK
jgi:hypothetical protein